MPCVAVVVEWLLEDASNFSDSRSRLLCAWSMLSHPMGCGQQGHMGLEDYGGPTVITIGASVSVVHLLVQLFIIMCLGLVHDWRRPGPSYGWLTRGDDGYSYGISQLLILLFDPLSAAPAYLKLVHRDTDCIGIRHKIYQREDHQFMRADLPRTCNGTLLAETRIVSLSETAYTIMALVILAHTLVDRR
jgi:hypothetical protein